MRTASARNSGVRAVMPIRFSFEAKYQVKAAEQIRYRSIAGSKDEALDMINHPDGVVFDTRPEKMWPSDPGQVIEWLDNLHTAC